MPIFDQGYQHWQGKLGGQPRRIWAISWRGVRSLFRSRWTRLAVVAGLGPSLALAAVLVFWGLVENKVSFIQPLLAMLSGLPEELRNKPEAYRQMVWTLAFQFFFSLQVLFMMILVAIVGPDLISKDLRFNAMPLYFSRPLRRWDYFLGKLGVIAFYVGLVTVLPVTVAYTLGVAFSFSVKIIGETWHLLAGGILAGTIMVFSAGGLMLALSSLTRNSRYVAALWIGLWLVSEAVAGILIANLPAATWPPVCSYTTNLVRVTERLLRVDTAWETIDKLVESVKTQAQQQAGRLPMGVPGMAGLQEVEVPTLGTAEKPMPHEEARTKLRRAGLTMGDVLLRTSRSRDPGDQNILVIGQTPLPGTKAPRGSTVMVFTIEAGVLKRVPPEVLARIVRNNSESDEIDFRWYRMKFPWTWSALVLTGLFLLSILVLMTRVKSLDRLK